MVHRGIATLSLSLVACFLLLSAFDPQFFLVHFYESLVYLAIVLMLFYLEDRWAYMMGVLAPAVWLLLVGGIGALPDMWRQVERLFALRPAGFIGILGGITVVLSALMIVVCGLRWRREFAGLGDGWKTFLVSFVAVAIYYGFLVIWILRWIPIET